MPIRTIRLKMPGFCNHFEDQAVKESMSEREYPDKM